MSASGGSKAPDPGSLMSHGYRDGALRTDERPSGARPGTSRTCRATRHGGVARIVRLITSVVVGLIVVGIVLVLLEANRDNAIVDWLVGAGDTLSSPFHGIFSPMAARLRSP